MSTPAMESRIAGIIVELWGVDLARIVPEATLGEDLGGDNLDCVDLALAIEEAFEIAIPDERDGEIAAGTVGDLARLVDGLITEKQCAA